MSQWRSLKRPDGSLDERCVGLCTHTVAKIGVDESARFEAWRLSKPSVHLGMFQTQEAAKSAAAKDAATL